jgi:hypothetical protein
MRKIKEVLGLHFEARLSERQIAKICELGKGTVRRFLTRAEGAGLSWPLPPALEDAALEKQLFPPPSAGQRPQPDHTTIHQELKAAIDPATMQKIVDQLRNSAKPLQTRISLGSGRSCTSTSCRMASTVLRLLRGG